MDINPISTRLSVLCLIQDHDNSEDDDDDVEYFASDFVELLIISCYSRISLQLLNFPKTVCFIPVRLTSHSVSSAGVPRVH